AESFIRVEIDRNTDLDECATLRNDLRQVLDDVRAATTDWQPMRAAVDTVLGELTRRPVPLAADELEEVRALLSWMADGHFALLGYREADLTAHRGSGSPVARPQSGLGPLRTDDGSEASPSFARLPDAARAAAWDPTLLVVTKTNARSTVHRAGYLDYVGVKK